MQCSSPKRENIRAEVCEANERNAEYMTKKYNKGKRVKVAEFRDGEHVTLKISSKMRHVSDQSHLPCVIVDKGSGNQPTYRLLCEFGTLKTR